MNRVILSLYRCLFVVLLTALMATARADSPNSYTGNRWAMEESGQVMTAAATITRKAYPDCDTAIVEQRSVRVYHADGTAEAQDETFEKVLTEKGRRECRTIGMSFMLPYDQVSVVKLEVIKPDGTVVPINVAANSKESIDQSQMSDNIYNPNSRVLRVNIPKLDIGDVVHSVLRDTTMRAIIPGQYSEEMLFEGDSFIRHQTYEVFAPKDRPLQKIALRAKIPGTMSYSTKTNADGSVTHLWEATNVPRMFDEPSMPPYEMVLQRLYVSTIPNWQAVSQWYWKLSLPHLEATSPDMEQTVSKLTAGAKSDLDKIKAIFYWVSKKIRYMGLTPEKNRPGFEPHDVKLTFDKKYGVCRDKAGLLVEMLREAGLKAYPVLASVGVKLDAEVPNPGFNHAIVGVELKKGHYLLMDPTDENTRELLPYYDRNQSYLICRPEGETLLTSPVESPDKNLMQVTTTGTLTANGVLTARSELSFEGVNDDAYRNAFVRMKPDDLRRFFERDLKRVLPDAKLESLKLTPDNMLDMSKNIHAELNYTASGLIAEGHGKAVLTIPWIGKGVGILNFILGDTGLNQRKYPLQTDTTCGLVERVNLKLGKGFDQVISLPNCPPEEAPCLASHQHFSWADQTLTAQRSLKLNVVEFSPAQYLTLKKTLKKLDYDARKMPVLALAKNAHTKVTTRSASQKNIPVQSDAVITYDQKQIDITSEHSAVLQVKYTKRILTYNGKKREAELKIPFNPSCQEAKLIHAVTISRSGKRSEISPDEINTMDAGWNASAKRYPGGKILVANLPDVDLGSTIDVEFEITDVNRPYLAGFESFQLPDELKSKSVKLTIPAHLKLHKLISGDKGNIKESRTSNNGQRVFTWTTGDVNAMPSESQLPPDWLYDSGVSYYVGNVQHYYQRLEQILLNRASKNTQAAALAKQLTAHIPNRLEAVKRIRDYVAQSIRQAGPSFATLPLKDLSAADVTLTDGYGHQADRAILLHAMLSSIGLKPEFVLASNLPPIGRIQTIVKSFPLPQYFHYPLVRVVVDGQAYYLNDTDQYAKLGTTAHANQLGLTLAHDKLIKIKPAKNCGPQSETDYTVKLTNDGQARIDITRRFFGFSYNAKKRFFAELPPEQRRRYFQNIVSAVAQGAKPDGDLVTQFDRYPGIEHYAVTVDHYAVVDGDYYYFEMPFKLSAFSAGANTRVLPLYIARDNQSRLHTDITFPSGFQRLVIAPKDQTLKAAGAGSARVSTRIQAGKFQMTQEMRVTPSIVSPHDYPSLQQTHAALNNKSNRVFMLEKK